MPYTLQLNIVVKRIFIRIKHFECNLPFNNILLFLRKLTAILALFTAFFIIDKLSHNRLSEDLNLVKSLL